MEMGGGFHCCHHPAEIRNAQWHMSLANTRSRGRQLTETPTVAATAAASSELRVYTCPAGHSSTTRHRPREKKRKAHSRLIIHSRPNSLSFGLFFLFPWRIWCTGMTICAFASRPCAYRHFPRGFSIITLCRLFVIVTLDAIKKRRKIHAVTPRIQWNLLDGNVGTQERTKREKERERENLGRRGNTLVKVRVGAAGAREFFAC